jgi:hypothetical protein
VIGRHDAAELKWNWDALIERFGPKGAGVFFILLGVAHGRRSFTMQAEDILPLLSEMARDQFDEFVEQLEIAGLIATQPGSYGSIRWTIGEPNEWSARPRRTRSQAATCERIRVAAFRGTALLVL